MADITADVDYSKIETGDLHMLSLLLTITLLALAGYALSLWNSVPQRVRSKAERDDTREDRR